MCFHRITHLSSQEVDEMRAYNPYFKDEEKIIGK
jgi:hypothetical protein